MARTKTTRREFVQGTVATMMASAAGRQLLAQTTSSANGIPTRPLGKTGERVSILGLGGAHIGRLEEPEAIRIMHAAMDQGMTFFDNSWDYNDGRSEEVMGRALQMDGRRKKVFLMTKDCERDYEGSLRCLEESLGRLRTDYLDLWQFHENNYDNDPDWLFEKGAVRAAVEAKKAGKVRHIGFTGHKDPRIHLKMLGKPFDWETSQMPINLMDFHYRSFQKEVVPVCLDKGVGVIGMKSLGGGPGKFVIDTDLTAKQCLRYALSIPVSTLVVGITSMQQLEEALEVARDFQPMDQSEKTHLLAQIRDVAGDGRHELFKSSKRYDGSQHRLQHGFAAG